MDNKDSLLFALLEEAIADLDSIELEHVDTIQDEEGTMPVYVLV